jgi:exodeoxyribonuclease VII large subunit
MSLLPVPHGTPTGAARKVYSITDLTQSIKETLEDHFGAVWVEGEISNLRQPSSGHCYFTLKDERAQLSAVLFRGNQRDLPFRLKDGLKVRAHGEVTVYEARGAYQIIVRRMEEAEKGNCLNNSKS